MRYLFALLLLITACNYEFSSKSEPAEIELVEANVTVVNQYNAASYEPLKLPRAYQSVARADLPPRQDATLQPIRAVLPPQDGQTVYRIGTADVITLASPNMPADLTQTGLLDAKARRQIYQVRGDGTISVPGIAPIPVAGLTLAAAEEAVFDALITENLEPNLSLEVTEYKSQSASISGDVATPMLANLTDKPLYLDQALQLAGGVTALNPDQTIVRLFRGGERFQLSARDAQSGRLGRIALQDADRIVVEALAPANDPARNAAITEGATQFDIRARQLAAARQNFDTALTLGAVKRQSVYILGEDQNLQKLDLPFETKAKLADALAIAETADTTRHVYILRFTPSGQKAIYFDLRDTAALFLTTRMELRPDDVIYLPDQKLRNWQGLAAIFKGRKS